MATITSATSGDYATGATWVGGIAPVLGDKAIIAHTSTGLAQFSTNTAGYAIGATAITLTGSVAAGSFVINENVQFAGDPNYYLITNWVSGTKVLTVTPLIVAIPATATLVMTRGHIVTVAGTVAGGDDTSTGITVNGTLKASRVATSELTARGDIFINTSGTLDYGTESDPIPVAYTATLIINSSAAPANNKWGIRTSETTTWFGVRFWGSSKTVDTTFTTAVGSADTVLNVADTTGWAIGDWLGFGPSTAGGTITARAITAVTASTVTIGASLAATRLNGSKLMNVSSNVRVWGATGNTYTSHIAMRVSSSHAITNCIEIGPSEFRLNGGGGGTNIAHQFGGIIIYYQSTSNTTNVVKKINGPVVHSYWSVSGSTVTSIATVGTFSGYEFFGNQAAKITVQKIYLCGSTPGVVLYSGASVDITTYKALSSHIQFQCGYSQGPVDCNINGGWVIGGIRIGNSSGVALNFNNLEIDALTRLYDGNMIAFGLVNFTNCAIGQTIGLGNSTTGYQTAAGALCPTVITDCTLLDTFSADMSSTSYKTQHPANYLKIVNRNLDPQRQEKYVRGGRNYRSSTVNYRSKYAMTYECWNTATGITETSTIPIDASATIKLIGYVRFNAAFGTATPPTVTISGMGITPQVYTCTATADTWFKYEFDVTNPQIYGGNLTATFYAITASAGATAQCYFDGLIVSPYCTDSRHYGYLFDINAYRTVNSVITETDEATVGAYTGIAVDHTTNTLTISSTHSVAEIYDYVYYDLVQTANLSEPEWFTSTDGINFSCTYDIVNTSVITGTGTITTTQQYTGGGTSSVIIVDSTGTFNNMTITGLIANSRVRINNETDNIELYNAVVAGTSVTIPSFWTTNKTLDLRVTNVIGLTAYLPYQAGGTLTATGASSLIAQELDSVYNTNAINGSTVTEFAADYPNVQVDIDDGDGSTSVQRLYAWFEYAMHSSQGIITYFNGITAQDTLNYQVNTNVVDLEFDNVSATSIPIKITGAYIFRDDGTTVIYSGSKSIQMDPARAYSVGVSGLTTAQAAELTQIYNRVDENISAIAVGWNPYIGDMKKGMNSVIKKIEEKGEEVKEKIETEVKTIVIPEQKEPIVNVTTEKIDTEQFMKAIKDIPAPIVNVTTETVNIEPIITEIKKIGKIEDIKFPEYPEQKEMDMSGMEKCMEEIEEKIENIPDNTQSIRKIEEYISKKEEEERNEEKIKEEEENMNRPLPNSFTAVLK